MAKHRSLLALLACLLSCLIFLIPSTVGFTFSRHTSVRSRNKREEANDHALLMSASANSEDTMSSRRVFFEQALFVSASVLTFSQSSLAAEKKDLGDCLYTIVRVREATQQETRLIKTGKFKDVQRANVKLAVKFMIQNYRLSDTFITASSYIADNSKRVAAGDAGQTAVQNLYTILEYFDSSDVQNIKVDNMSGKEELVLKGLESARKSIDSFLAFFPSEKVDAAVSKVKAENELNRKEFDPALGDILNPSPADK